MVKVNVFSWNAQGLNNNIKYNSCLQYLDKKKIDIALLQETHIISQDINKLENNKYQIISSSSAANKTKGVLILISKKINLNIIEKGNDLTGRIAFAKILLYGKKILLLSAYAPNSYDPAFFDQLTTILQDHLDSAVILGTDMNAVLLPEMDKSGPSSGSSATTALNNLVANHSLIDVWRRHNPNLKQYTFFSHRHKTFSRIDC